MSDVRSSDVLRVANCSGFYGDRLSAAREMVEGGPIDYLTGDYLAELTMTILYNQMQSRGENMGYVGTFLKQELAFPFRHPINSKSRVVQVLRAVEILPS